MGYSTNAFLGIEALEYEGVILRPGSVLSATSNILVRKKSNSNTPTPLRYTRPATPRYDLPLDHAITNSWHFYASSSIQESISVLVYAFVLGKFTRTLFRRMMISVLQS
jgi:hypothetical protein